jgi:hypothetical protein
MSLQLPNLTPRRGAPRKLEYLKTKAISVRLPQWVLDRMAESGKSQAQQIVNALITTYGWSPRAAAVDQDEKTYTQKTESSQAGQGDAVNDHPVIKSNIFL